MANCPQLGRGDRGTGKEMLNYPESSRGGWWSSETNDPESFPISGEEALERGSDVSPGMLMGNVGHYQNFSRANILELAELK